MNLTVNGKGFEFSCSYGPGPLFNTQGDREVESLLRLLGVTFADDLFQKFPLTAYPGDFFWAEYLVSNSQSVGITAVHHVAKILEKVINCQLTVSYCQCLLFTLQANLSGKIGYLVFPDEVDGCVLAIHRHYDQREIINITIEKADRLWPKETTFVYFRKA